MQDFFRVYDDCLTLKFLFVILLLLLVILIFIFIHLNGRRVGLNAFVLLITPIILEIFCVDLGVVALQRGVRVLLLLHIISLRFLNRKIIINWRRKLRSFCIEINIWYIYLHWRFFTNLRPYLRSTSVFPRSLCGGWIHAVGRSLPVQRLSYQLGHIFLPVCRLNCLLRDVSLRVIDI